MEEEFQEADVLWPWPDTPPSPDSPASSELYECDATTVVGFSCDDLFSEPAAASLSSASTSSALVFDRSSSESSEDDGFFFLSGGSTAVSNLAAEEFLEKDVLWPDTEDDVATAEIWRRRCRRVEEAAAAACGKREGWELLVSSPIDIPAATRAAAAHRRPSPSAVPLRRHW